MKDLNTKAETHRIKLPALSLWNRSVRRGTALTLPILALGAILLLCLAQPPIQASELSCSEVFAVTHPDPSASTDSDRVTASAAPADATLGHNVGRIQSSQPLSHTLFLPLLASGGLRVPDSPFGICVRLGGLAYETADRGTSRLDPYTVGLGQD